MDPKVFALFAGVNCSVHSYARLTIWLEKGVVDIIQSTPDQDLHDGWIAPLGPDGIVCLNKYLLMENRGVEEGYCPHTWFM